LDIEQRRSILRQRTRKIYPLVFWFLSPLTLWVQIPLGQCVLDTTLFDKVCQWLVAGQWFSPGTLVSSTNKTNCHNITEILLKVALNTINQTKTFYFNTSPWYLTSDRAHGNIYFSFPLSDDLSLQMVQQLWPLNLLAVYCLEYLLL
jgi:hypothetical protein